MGATGKGNAKSGLRVLKPGEILFHDGEKATSLFIIQKGQLRLFKPKGKGFIEIAVLRAGEVIGEMAYFDDAGGGKRSCSASAMVTTEIIEISFTAFGKTMSGLNPWFKTIINTLANRLRSTNARVKELESNSTTVSYSTGKHSAYEFFKTNDVIKILGTLFLVFKSHGENHPDGMAINKKTLKLYSHDIFGVVEAKMIEMEELMCELGLIKVVNDKDNLPNIMVTKSLDQIRSLFIFYNTEKHLTEDKKLKISKNCQIFLEKLWDKIDFDPESKETMTMVRVDSMLASWKEKKMGVTLDSLEDARDNALVGDVIVGDENELLLEVYQNKVQKLLPTIRFMNRVITSNRAKSSMG